MPQRFAQISDPHLTSLERVSATELFNKRALGYLSWRRRRRFEHRAEVLDTLQLDLKQYSLDQLLITGDLTHIGLPSEFQQARAWLQKLGSAADIALVPGNHDACVRAAWEQTFALWADYMAGDNEAQGQTQFPTVRKRGDITFIGVTTGVPKPPLMATGTAGPAQLEELAPLLVEAREQGLFRVVYLHHCPLEGREKWRKRLTDAADIQRVLQENGVELVLHGHGHRKHRVELVTRDGSAPVIATPSASAMGLHGADVAEYNLYSVDRLPKGWQLSIQSRRYDTGLGSFVEAERTQLQLERKSRKT